MKFEASINGKRISVNVLVQAGRLSFSEPGRNIEVLLDELSPGYYCARLGSRVYPVWVVEASGSSIWSVQTRGREFDIELLGRDAGRGSKPSTSSGTERLTARMAGRVVRVLVGPGERIRANEGVLIVEAMKMQNEVRAVADGTVKQILVREGQTVGAGDPLALIEPISTPGSSV